MFQLIRIAAAAAAAAACWQHLLGGRRSNDPHSTPQNICILSFPARRKCCCRPHICAAQPPRVLHEGCTTDEVLNLHTRYGVWLQLLAQLRGWACSTSRRTCCKLALNRVQDSECAHNTGLMHLRWQYQRPPPAAYGACLGSQKPPGHCAGKAQTSSICTWLLHSEACRPVTRAAPKPALLSAKDLRGSPEVKGRLLAAPP